MLWKLQAPTNTKSQQKKEIEQETEKIMQTKWRNVI